MKKAHMAKQHAIRMFLLVVFLFSGIFTASLAPAEGFYLYGAVESFEWREFADSGARAVNESGPLFGIGLDYSHEFEDRLIVSPKGQIFFGNVDYDGQTQAGEPVTSTVGYFGLTFDGDLSMRFKVTKSFFLEPFGGLGLRWWLRDIKDGTTSSNTVSPGYTEAWTTLYGRLGARAGIDVSKQTQVFFEAGVKLPFYNQNTAYLSNIGNFPDITLHPGLQASFFAEAGTTIGRVRASIFYDSLRFSRSPSVVKDVGNVEYMFWQPQSTMDAYGVKVGVVF